ncbi:MAG: nucleotidyltransferase domain-containing protein, partial [Lachnospiraceae bacterium]|nr:nucleotidyltransferase domain-containing protein [Lachnospiraceae bacterium]
ALLEEPGTTQKTETLQNPGSPLAPEPPLTPALYEAIRELLARKAKTEEKDLKAQMPVIIEFIREECARQKQISDAAKDDHRHDYTELNEAFRKLLQGTV